MEGKLGIENKYLREKRKNEKELLAGGEVGRSGGREWMISRGMYENVSIIIQSGMLDSCLKYHLVTLLRV